jgi:hypothetical protein
MAIATETSYSWEKHFSDLDAKLSAPIQSIGENSDRTPHPLYVLIDKHFEDNALGKPFGNTSKGTRLSQEVEPTTLDTQDDEQIFANQLDQDLQTRVELLCRKYANKSLSKEQNIRFEIVTQRSILALPRIRDEDFDKLDEINRKMKSSFEDIENLLD